MNIGAGLEIHCLILFNLLWCRGLTVVSIISLLVLCGSTQLLATELNSGLSLWALDEKSSVLVIGATPPLPTYCLRTFTGSFLTLVFPFLLFFYYLSTPCCSELALGQKKLTQIPSLLIWLSTWPQRFRAFCYSWKLIERGNSAAPSPPPPTKKK